MPSPKLGRLTLSRIDALPADRYRVSGSVTSQRIVMDVAAAVLDSFSVFAAELAAIGFEANNANFHHSTAWTRAVNRAMRIGGVPAADRPTVA